MDAAQWPPHQEIGLVKPIEEMVGSGHAGPGPRGEGPAAAAAAAAHPQLVERRTRPQKEKALNCPRCNSTNTKFCYYNNYSLTQPRYFCKTCRRYWTEGGSLRNVPVGGGSRKNKRSSSSASATATAAASTAALAPSSSVITAAKFALPNISLAASAASQNPKLIHEGAHDLNLAFPFPEYSAFPTLENSNSRHTNTNACTAVGPVSAMELLRSAGMAPPGGGLGPFMPMPDYTPAGFGLPEFRSPQPSLSFSLDGIGGAGSRGAAYHGGLQGVEENRLLFPFEDLKPSVSSSGGNADQYEQNKQQAAADHPEIWNGMMGGGGSSSWNYN